MLVVCLLFPYLFIQFCYSQNDTIKLEEIEIQGIRPEISNRAPNPVQIMSAKKLDAIPSATLAEAIRNFSGVVIKDYGGIGGLKTVMIRSLGANHTAVFIDGILQTDASTGQTDLGRIPLQSIESIELSIGKSAFDLKPARMYASASILNISGTEFDFSEERDFLGLYLKAGSFGSFNPLISYDRKINDNIKSGVRLNYYTSHGKYNYKSQNGLITDKLTRSNSDIETIDAIIKSTISFHDSSLLKIKVSLFKSDRGLPGAVILYNPHSSQRLLNRDVIVGLQYSNHLKKSIKELVSAGYTYSSLLYRDPDFLNESGGLRNEYNQQEFYLSEALALTSIRNLKVTLSTDLIYNKLSSNAYSIASPTRLSSLTATSATYLFQKTEIQASMLMTAAADINNELSNNKYFKLSPAISYLHSFLRDNSLKTRITYKNTFRMPSFNDLYYTISGNNNLSAENASLYNIGLLYNKSFSKASSLSIRSDGFFNKVTNKIVSVPTRNLFIWSTKNLGKVDIKGIELFGGFTYLINKEWSLDISGTYTYQNARDVTDKSTNVFGKQVSYIPFETASALGMVYYKKYSIGANYLYNGYRYTSASNDQSSVIPSWKTLDLTIARKWTSGNNKFDLKIEISNVLNEQYEVIKGFPMTGRAIFISISTLI